MAGTIKWGNSKRKPSKLKQDREEQKRRSERDTVSVIRGMETEDRFLKSLQSDFGNKPGWFRGVRRGLGFEDKHQETDLVVDTDYGDVRIDVKSSSLYAKKTFKGENVLTLVLPLNLDGKKLQDYLFKEIKTHLRRTHYTFDVFEMSRIFFKSV